MSCLALHAPGHLWPVRSALQSFCGFDSSDSESFLRPSSSHTSCFALHTSGQKWPARSALQSPCGFDSSDSESFLKPKSTTTESTTTRVGIAKPLWIQQQCQIPTTFRYVYEGLLERSGNDSLLIHNFCLGCAKAVLMGQRV